MYIQSILFLIGIFSYGNLFASSACIQVIQPALNETTWECRLFSTPCDVPQWWKKVSSCKEDIQIIEKIESTEKGSLKKEQAVGKTFVLKKERSCWDLETVIEKFLQEYYKRVGQSYRRWEMFTTRGMPSVMKNTATQESSLEGQMRSNAVTMQQESATDVSMTNVQVAGIDEGDILKNDSKYIYYYNSKDNAVYILEGYPPKNSRVLKKIVLPQWFWWVELYIENNKLIILGTKYYSHVAIPSSWREIRSWYPSSTVKTYVIIYNTENKEKLVLEKMHVFDGELKKSRKTKGYVYIITGYDITLPMYELYSKKNASIDVNIQDVLPKEVSVQRNLARKNLKIWKKQYPYTLSEQLIGGKNCQDIEYILPDNDTMEQYEFSPSVNVISVIPLGTNEELKHTVLFWDIHEIYMSHENLYITNYIYTKVPFFCLWRMRCILPYYGQWEQTLIHKYTIDKHVPSYHFSTIVPWTPLNQYSMDEFDDSFRILTKTSFPQLDTHLFIMDKHTGALISSLENIQPWEEFKSSRYMGDKLFLVTFERVDPLFVIDLKDIKNPKILWELKIPGYSTYLHPYDDTHIIGIGYDTKENSWGGISNNGVKVDLYKVYYDKHCNGSNLTQKEKEKCESWEYKGIIIEQKATKTFWWAGSSSEVLFNPRMFVFKKSESLLLFPAQLYTSRDKNNDYNYHSFQSVTLVLRITPQDGIVELARLTNIDLKKVEEEQKKECNTYFENNKEKKECRRLLNGEMYCPSPGYSQGFWYIPEYCFEGTSPEEYLAKNSYKFQDDFIVRNMYMDSYIYTISNNTLNIFDMNNKFQRIKQVLFQEKQQ